MIAAVAMLLVRSASAGVELTAAVLLIVVAFAAAQLNVPAMTIVAWAPPAREANRTTRLFPAPSQLPPAEEEHVTNAIAAGRLSVTTTLEALPGLLFFTVIV